MKGLWASPGWQIVEWHIPTKKTSPVLPLLFWNWFVNISYSTVRFYVKFAKESQWKYTLLTKAMQNIFVFRIPCQKHYPSTWANWWNYLQKLWFTASDSSQLEVLFLHLQKGELCRKDGVPTAVYRLPGAAESVTEHQSLSPEAQGRWCLKTSPDTLTLPPKTEPRWFLWLSRIPTPLLHPQSSSRHILSASGRDKDRDPFLWLQTPTLSPF